MIRNRKLARITADASYRQFNIKAIPLFQDKLITEAGLIKTISQYTRDSPGTNTLFLIKTDARIMSDGLKNSQCQKLAEEPL